MCYRPRPLPARAARTDHRLDTKLERVIVRRRLQRVRRGGIEVRTELCDVFGIDVPLFAFSHCRDVVAAVSRAGGMGVLGALAFSPEQLDVELRWIDQHVDGRPYGVDVIIPASYAGADLDGPDLVAQLEAMVPEGHRQFVEDILARHGVAPLPAGVARPRGLLGWTNRGGRSQVEVALSHPIALLANALGPA